MWLSEKTFGKRYKSGRVALAWRATGPFSAPRKVGIVVCPLRGEDLALPGPEAPVSLRLGLTAGGETAIPGGRAPATGDYIRG